MNRTFRFALAAGLALVLLVSLPLAPAETEVPEKLRDEDVVRLHISGVSAEAIVRQIRESDVEFDLSEEMLNELRAAGLPAEVVRAMVERQRHLDRRRRSEEIQSRPEIESEELDGARLVVALRPLRESDEPKPVVVFDSADPALQQTLLLDEEEREVTDIAFYLACTRAEHVPDHWRGKSPLGRDFASMPRHRLLAFVAGAEHVEPDGADRLGSKLARGAGGPAAPPPGRLELELPSEIEATLPGDGAHDLLLGLALRIEGRYYRISDAAWEGLTADPGGTTELAAVVVAPRIEGSPAYELRFVR